MCAIEVIKNQHQSLLCPLTCGVLRCVSCGFYAESCWILREAGYSKVIESLKQE